MKENRKKVMQSGIQFNMDDGVPFSPKKVLKGRLADSQSNVE